MVQEKQSYEKIFLCPNKRTIFEHLVQEETNTDILGFTFHPFFWKAKSEISILYKTSQGLFRVMFILKMLTFATINFAAAADSATFLFSSLHQNYQVT